MGLFSNKISRDKLSPGDHIYTWRTLFVFAHHGIYIGDGKVVHFTTRSSSSSRSGAGARQTETGTFLDKISVSSSSNTRQCPNCGHPSREDGVISSCLDCFLKKGKLYLYKYNVSLAKFLAKPRGGTCTIASSDLPHEVISRANFLLEHNGFGAYVLESNNCETFAVYCKTESLFLEKDGLSGQVNSAIAAVPAAVLCFGSPVVFYGVYSIGRLLLDSAVGDSTVIKVSAERLLELNKARDSAEKAD